MNKVAAPKDIRDTEFKKAMREKGTYIEGGDIHTATDDTERALADSESGIYQRDHALVEIVVSTKENKSGIKRSDSQPIISPVKASTIREKATKLHTYFKYDQRIKDYKKVDCPRDVAITLLERASWPNIPYLRNVLSAPTVTDDGNIIDTHGYNDETEIYLYFHKWEKVNKKKLKKEDAVKARQLLEDLVSEFPFIDEAALSAWMAALLTALVRWQLPSSPFFGIDAPVMGSGKTLLATIISYLISAEPPAVITQPPDENELNKLLHTLLMSGDPLILMDNAEHPVSGQALNIMATSQIYRARILGESRTSTVSTAVTVIVTGNNLTIKGDLSTRFLISRLDPGVENPEQRTFKRENILKFALENRQSLVNAGLIIMKAYIDSGKPDVGLKPFGRFEQWDDLIRFPLVWSGAADPCDTRKRVETSDPEREQLGELLDAWATLYQDKEVLVANMIHDATSADDEAKELLRDALLVIAADGTKINSRRLGRRISKWESRVCDGLRITRGGLIHKVQSWKLESINGGYGGYGGLGGFIPTNARKSQMGNNNSGAKETPVTPITPHKKIKAKLAKACDGLKHMSVDVLISKLSEDDLKDIQSGNITDEEISNWAKHFDDELGKDTKGDTP